MASSMRGYNTYGGGKTSNHEPASANVEPLSSDPAAPSTVDGDDNGDETAEDARGDGSTHPLPLKQLVLLALLSLAEQTALNSISPYMPTMVRSFPGVRDEDAGFYVGVLASAFAVAQLATNLMWGIASDRVGRKPIMLLGSSMLAVCFALFGFCSRYWHAVLVQVAMGLLNGNASVVFAAVGDVTDLENQGTAYTWVPLMFIVGGITGPAVGGLLVAEDPERVAFPFFWPNAVSATLLVIAVVVLAFAFDETLNKARTGPVVPVWLDLGWFESLWERLCTCCGRRPKPRGRLGSWSSRWPTRASWQDSWPDAEDDDDFSSDEEDETFVAFGGSRQNVGDEETALLGSRTQDDPHHSRRSARRRRSSAAGNEKPLWRQLLNHTTLVVLAAYLVSRLSDNSFNSLYPIFASSPGPTGRELSPETIGLLLSLAGVLSIVFQIFFFDKLIARSIMGAFRASLLALVVCMALMPWVGAKSDTPPFGLGSGRAWLYVELGALLVIKSIAAAGGLASAKLLVNNSAPSPETLGTLNGLSETLAAAGRAVGPLISGGLFSASTRVPRGELLAWGVLSGIAFTGWLGCLSVSGRKLENPRYHHGYEDAGGHEHTAVDESSEQREGPEP